MKKSTTLRPFKLQKSYLPHAEGSCLVTMGKTKVLCVATVEDRSPPFAEVKGLGWVTAEYAMLPRSGESRTTRKRAMSSGRSQEISRLIGRSLRAVVSLEDLGLRSITVDCDVIRADGGTRTASINGAMVAMTQAIVGLWKKKKIFKWPLKNFVGAVSIGMVDKKPLLDMCYDEDKNAETDMNVVMTNKGNLIEIQGTAEGKAFSIQELNTMIKISQKAIAKIILNQKKVLGRLPK